VGKGGSSSCDGLMVRGGDGSGWAPVILVGGDGVLAHQKVKTSKEGPKKKGEEDRSLSSPWERRVVTRLLKKKMNEDVGMSECIDQFI
jgi:hypothetical protein